MDTMTTTAAPRPRLVRRRPLITTGRAFALIAAHADTSPITLIREYRCLHGVSLRTAVARLARYFRAALRTIRLLRMPTARTIH
jgi:hypothetical protein